MRQESRNIAPRIRATVMRLPTTLERMSVNAVRAPPTSVLSLLTSAPVCARVKNASGISLDMAEQLRAQREHNPAPICEERYVCARPSAPSKSPSTPTMAAKRIMSPAFPRRMPLLMISRKMKRIHYADRGIHHNNNQEETQQAPRREWQTAACALPCPASPSASTPMRPAPASASLQSCFPWVSLLIAGARGPRHSQCNCFMKLQTDARGVSALVCLVTIPVTIPSVVRIS